MNTQPKWRQAFDITATLCMVACGVALWWEVARGSVGPPPPPTITVPKDILRIGHSPVEGSRAAPVAIIEFSEFECPFCRLFARNTRDRLLREFVVTGKVLLVYRHLPLDMHKNAVSAAVAASCAQQQGQFWPAYDIIFGGSPKSAAADVRAQAGRLGLNASAFDDCLRREPVSTIQADKAEAARLGITGTPAFLVGTLRNGEDIQVRTTIAGAKPYAEFQTAIEHLLKVK